MLKVVAPIGIFKKADNVLLIRWNDATQTEFSLRSLRSACPCAVCVNEWSGEKILDEAKIPADIKPTRLFSVGRYAMGIHWSDGHATGIFSYDFLKKIVP